MHRLNFLKAPVSLLLGTELVTFFRPEKEELATLIADIEPSPGPFSELTKTQADFNKAILKQYSTVDDVYNAVREYDYVNERWGPLVKHFRKRGNRA